ncbi:MAG: MerR family transcriptional regulator [Cryobacterium sp.]|nr:MerR family transcriptional regulator [Oligoflexia bacterium]
MKVNPPFPHLRTVEDERLLASFDPVIETSFSGAPIREEDEENDDPSVIPALERLASFDLGAALAQIPGKLFFRIGEVADLLGVKAYVLRFWETEFPMVHPTKSRSGQRVYQRKDVEMLLLIKHLLYVERFSIEGARKRIRELKMKPATVAANLSPKPSENPGLRIDPAKAISLSLSESDRHAITEIVGEAERLALADIKTFFRF